MYAIYIESSHVRGMGHLFRGINIYEYLRNKGKKCIILLNADPDSIRILEKHNVNHAVINSIDSAVDAMRLYDIDTCIMDRFCSELGLCSSLSAAGVLLVGIDDCGDGAEYFDIHFGGLFFSEIKGKQIYKGKEYIILNPEIAEYRHKRDALRYILVTLGGTDTYGVTVTVAELLKEKGISADIVIGPGFKHKEELFKVLNCDGVIKRDGGSLRSTHSDCFEQKNPVYRVYDSVDSLIKLMSEYDLAITGGGVTCVEANASGLPCVIVANELHEVDIANYVSGFGGAVFAGYYRELDDAVFQNIEKLDIEDMSQKGMQTFDLNGLDNIFRIIEKYRNK